MSAFVIFALLAFLYFITSPGSSGSLTQSSGAGATDGFLSWLGTTPTNTTGVTVYNSDGSLTGSQITNDPATWPGDDKIWNICAAVAFAEGYNQGSGTAPFDLNNPGDLSPGDEHGQITNGAPEYHDGSYIIAFAYAEGGWQALYNKFSDMVNGRSSVYPQSFTWSQVAKKYAGNSVAWLGNVTSYLGVDPNSTPAQYVNS